VRARCSGRSLTSAGMSAVVLMWGSGPGLDWDPDAHDASHVI
jgi:hypothetical protein